VAAGEDISLTSARRRLLAALAYYAALGVERQRLVAAAERAEAERRVESLRRALLTAVSHDLRTPLTTIKGIAHEIAGGADPARAEVIEAEADRLDALVADFLDLSRIQAGAIRPDATINTADDLVGAALQRAAGVLEGRAVEVEMEEGDLITGRFDFAQTLRALVNLLDNAAKYSPAGSPLTVRARRAPGAMEIAVLDEGPGVPEGERDRIFDAFYRPPTVPAAVRGTGLGLSIARGLAEAQGGSLRYAVRPGGGSIFTLVLPADAQALGAAEPALGTS
jgi:two-component system sensor histidine kinase KdpD